MRTFITRGFIDRIGDTGQLATAARRLVSIEAHEPLPKMSTWTLVCEEVVDTTHSDAYYERVLAELYRRGLTPEEVRAMRVFAWETAGWLNFEKMVWEWCILGEADIEHAISWRLKEKDITEAEASSMRQFLAKYREESKAAQPGATDNPGDAQ